MQRQRRRRHSRLPLKRQQARRRLTRLAPLIIAGSTLLLAAFRTAGSYLRQPVLLESHPVGRALGRAEVATSVRQIQSANGRPSLSPLPIAEEVWECEVVVIGGTLGGVGAASHAMRAGGKTCLIELTPWLGGQISSQGVSAIDESRAMRWRDNFSPSWEAFKRLIRRQPVYLPSWTGLPSPMAAYEVNSCWVGELCFSPRAGATAAEMWLRSAAIAVPDSRWSTSTAFKGAAFDPSGRNITAVYAVKRIPRNPNYSPRGRLSLELQQWYAWEDDDTFNKIPIRLQPPEGQRMIVIDATDTGELVGWANLPHRVGSDSKSYTGEVNAPPKDNPDCTQAYTYPFALATVDDGGDSFKRLKDLDASYARKEFRKYYDLEGFPFFDHSSVFNYRRIVSQVPGASSVNRTRPGEITLINWNRGNDWHLMEPPLILVEDDILLSGQRQDWLGGLSTESLQLGEENSLLFAEWLIETQTWPLPLTYLHGPDAPLGTYSGLSMVPYIREGRRLLGRPAYGQEDFMILEADLREDMSGGRDFSSTAIALAHYDIDIHGCLYRNNRRPSYEASSASIKEFVVRPLQIPLEALIPQGVDNVLIGGKSLAVSHIANGLTRVHYAEWSIGAAAGATSGWLLRHGQPEELTPSQIIVTGQMPKLQQFLRDQGLRFTW